MANTYYSQFEFDADDDDGGSGDEQEKEERTLVGGQDEMAQYIGHLQGALESQTNGTVGSFTYLTGMSFRWDFLRRDEYAHDILLSYLVHWKICRY